MKSFIAIVCVLLAVAGHCTANAIEPVDARVTCAEATYELVKAFGLRLVDQYSDRLDALRGNYTACNALATGGPREQCHLEYGRHVVQVLLGLREQLQEIKDAALRLTLEQLDTYFACRSAARFLPNADSESTPSFCAVTTYEAARRALLPFLKSIEPDLETLREGITQCYYRPEAQKASCYYQLLLSVRTAVARFLEHLERRRPVLVAGAINLLDGYYVCRSAA